MNNTHPSHTQFFQKPVFAALGMLSNLGSNGNDIQIKENWHGYKVTYLSTTGEISGPMYLATILVFELKRKSVTAESKIQNQFVLDLPLELMDNMTIWFVVEGLILNVTDPYYVWKRHGSPEYPNAYLRHLLRKVQGPMLLQHGRSQNRSSLEISLGSLSFSNSSVILVRACSEENYRPKYVFNLRLRRINENETLIIWSDHFSKNKCILTYQVYFRREHLVASWKKISKNVHVPFMNFQHKFRKSRKRQHKNCYKIRSIDITGKKSPFSNIKCEK